MYRFRVPASAVVLATLFTASSVTADEMSPKTVINPPGLSDSLQYGYSQATVAPADARLIHVAGQVGITDEGPNDFESQVDRAFDNLSATLAAAGGRAEDVIKITLLIKDHDDEKLQYLVGKRRAFFGSTPPASTLIPVTALYAPHVLFEIDAVAVAGDDGANPGATDTR